MVKRSTVLGGDVYGLFEHTQGFSQIANEQGNGIVSHEMWANLDHIQQLKCYWVSFDGVVSDNWNVFNGVVSDEPINVTVCTKYECLAYVYMFYGLDNKQLLYVGYTNNFARRLEEHAKTKWWFRQIGKVHVVPCELDRAQMEQGQNVALELERLLIEIKAPLYNKAHNTSRDVYGSLSWHAVKCPYCGWIQDPWDDIPDEKSMTWVSAHVCSQCSTEWNYSWQFPSGEQLDGAA